MDWSNVSGVVFDLDGTLYRQSPVRLRMACRLLAHAFTTRGGLREAAILRYFRRQRELMAGCQAAELATLQYQPTADAFAIAVEEVAEIVARWMEVAPLDLLAAAKYADQDKVIAVMRQQGIKVAVLSDYPVENKLAALGIEVDAYCHATQSDVSCCKPGTVGLLKLTAQLGLSVDSCVMIGDRLDRDGACANSAGMRFLHCNGRSFYTNLLNALDADEAFDA